MSIANLLRRYPAVGVPGIGVFKKTHQPAAYDADRSAFLPPEDRIELVDGDTEAFQLTTYLAAQHQLDEGGAKAMLEGAVAAVMNAISRNGEALLDGLGYLLADGATFIFKPFEADRFVAKPIAAPSPAAHEPDEPEIPVDHVADVPVEPTEELVVSEGGTDRRSYTPWMIGGIIAAMLIASVVVWKYQPAWFGGAVVDRKAVPDKQAVLPSPSEEKIPLVDGDRDSVIADSSLLAAAVDSLRVDSVPVASAPPAKPSVTYEIIVGSFATMRQADKFVAEMKAKGYDLQAIDSKMPGNRKKISWGSYATEEAAYRELARVQKTFEPGAWIAKITHN
ncbi:SPOR domain-containing protein [Parapedobacter sp. 10938]|uniref:SPOR domain-containing protein n=1 Tax=Parapedobacter flavus TaxID=3110225 RepID=UPI002DBF89F3|nr:SPOR domain-containing protein [Parapedobacter sp. 10938]MEC3879018.1 SPOR domain-containing protein [Parapedobacter sp. 10938]